MRPPRNTCRPLPRRGLTLLEVLIAIFVLAIGLLGVASMIPVGRFQMEQAARSDRAAAVGRAAWREVEIRGMLELENWRNWQGSVFGFVDAAPNDGPPQEADFAWLDLDEPFVPGNIEWNRAMIALREAFWDNGSSAIRSQYGNFTGGGAIRSTLGPLGRGNAICIDPLFIAANQPGAGNQPSTNFYIRSFPYPLTNDPGLEALVEFDGWPATGDDDPWVNPPRMQRITIRVPAPPDPGPDTEIPEAVVSYTDTAPNLAYGGPPPLIAGLPHHQVYESYIRRLFIWRDDATFEVPDGEGRRPRQQTVNAGATVLTPEAAGEYSWLVTVAPAAGQMAPKFGLGTAAPGNSVVSENRGGSENRLFTVSVVVFHRRDVRFAVANQVPVVGSLNPLPGTAARPAPAERMVWCDFLGNGRGGGAARLRLPVTLPNLQVNIPRSDLPKVVVGQWILIAGWQQPDLQIGSGTPPQMPPDLTSNWANSPANPPNRRAVFRWYRVTSVNGDPQFEPATSTAQPGGCWYQDVTLAGPDWDPNQFLDADAPNNTARHSLYVPGGGASSRTCHAGLIRGVVAVFEKTIALDDFDD